MFPSKNALQTKRPVFYSPGEFTGRGSETHLHKRKVEILRFRAKRELSSNLPPKRKNRPEDRSVENFENGGAFRGFSEIFSPPQNGEFFKSQKGGKFIFSKNSPRVSLKAMQSFSPDPMYLKQNVHNFPDVIRMCGFAFENLRSDKLPAGSDFSTAAALFSATDRNARESFSRYSRFLLPREFFPILSSCELALT